MTAVAGRMAYTALTLGTVPFGFSTVLYGTDCHAINVHTSFY